MEEDEERGKKGKGNAEEEKNNRNPGKIRGKERWGSKVHVQMWNSPLSRSLSL